MGSIFGGEVMERLRYWYYGNMNGWGGCVG